MKRNWLIELRKSKKMTQENVATNAFIDRGYYAQIEKGVRNPSFSVALNIAKTLDFHPSLFFQDSSSPQILTNKIYKYFEFTDEGNVLYLYSNFEDYLQNAVTFLLTGIAKNSHTILIDNHENLIEIQQRLETIITNDKEKKTIYLIDADDFNQQDGEKLVKQYFKTHFDENVVIRIWLHGNMELENTVVSKLQTHINGKKILFLRILNALTVSAGTHIELMRKYLYLMTDLEIVYSPLYQSSDYSIIFPPLYQQ